MAKQLLSSFRFNEAINDALRWSIMPNSNTPRSKAARAATARKRQDALIASGYKIKGFMLSPETIAALAALAAAAGVSETAVITSLIISQKATIEDSMKTKRKFIDDREESLVSQDKIKSALVHAKEISSQGGVIEKWLKARLIEFYRSAKKVEFTEVDVGFDCSTYAHETEQIFDCSTLKTVEDLLDLPTGRTIPTYISGNGMAPETFRDVLIPDLEEVFFKEVIPFLDENTFAYGEQYSEQALLEDADAGSLLEKIRNYPIGWIFSISTALES